MKRFLLSTAVIGAVAGCATRSDEVALQYVSPLQYNSFDCTQIEQEFARISRRVSEVSGKQDETADQDAVAMGVGLVLFWPALFFIAGSDNAEELGRLKGEYEALQQAAIAKKCDITLIVQEAEDRKKAEAKAERLAQAALDEAAADR